MKILQKSQKCYETRYVLEFDYVNEPGRGFSFDCTAEGQPFLTIIENGKEVHNPVGAENYRQCLSGFVDGKQIVNRGVRAIEYSYSLPTIGECNICGTEVELSHFTNTCLSCGTDYNSSGQQLAPRHLWGEETGEHPHDCI